ncbi:MAG: 4Fe-4S binding protein, partial [Anaerovoracaceae bacterium]
MDRIRLLVQLLVAAVSNGYYVGFASGKIFQGSSKAFCVPGLNCYSCPGALGACPIGALQAVANTRNFTIPFYVLGTLMIFGALLGRVVCGWLCPFGLIQDLLHKIPFPRKIKTFKWDKGLRYVKYGILLFLVILLPMFVVNDYGQGVPWFCEYLCPSGTLMAGW